MSNIATMKHFFLIINHNISKGNIYKKSRVIILFVHLAIELIKYIYLAISSTQRLRINISFVLDELQ